jgi:hypothetical protein
MSKYLYDGYLSLSFGVELDEQLDLSTHEGTRKLLQAIYEGTDWDFFSEGDLGDVEVSEGEDE